MREIFNRYSNIFSLFDMRQVDRTSLNKSDLSKSLSGHWHSLVDEADPLADLDVVRLLHVADDLLEADTIPLISMHHILRSSFKHHITLPLSS